MPSRENIEHLANALGASRYNVWKSCEPHDPQQLPLTNSRRTLLPELLFDLDQRRRDIE
jgi:hypothetical protein